jgi:hypothetical protein
VVPVCSVGTYQAYLHAACCVCEVLPGALRFTEECEVLGLVAPRALMVINATKDAFQFSVGEAEKSIARARPMFKLYGVEDKLKHATFESPHAYNQAMRETMYGWMTLHLKGEGKGEPIPEPKHDIEKPEDLACYAEGTRPKTFLFPPSFAAQEARSLLARHTTRKPEHVEDWTSSAVAMVARLRKDVFGGFPKAPKPDAKLGKRETADGVVTTPLVIDPEPELPLPVLLRFKQANVRQPACVLLHLDGKGEAWKHPLAKELLEAGWAVATPDLRATGETKPGGDAVGVAPDHNSAEHALWVGRPLLGQWVFDVLCLLDWLDLQPALDMKKLAVVGLGQAGIVALCASALLEERVHAVASVDGPTTYVTEETYGAGTRMGLLAPGILRVGDVPHLAALSAPRKLLVAGGVGPQGAKLKEKELLETFAFPRDVYKLHKAEAILTIKEEITTADVVRGL